MQDNYPKEKDRLFIGTRYMHLFPLLFFPRLYSELCNTLVLFYGVILIANVTKDN